jgi:hypothetical protein
MKTQRRTIYIADDGSEHQTKESAEQQDTRIQMLMLIEQNNLFNGVDIINILLENGTYKFNK